jgi:hypothetical protein
VTQIYVLLRDRRRSQRGSVLSGVLIIVAFLAIISGALMTELSTNFLLSRNLLNRVQTEATVNSAAELALNQLQNAPLNSACPSPPQVTRPVNGQTWVVSYSNCYLGQRASPGLQGIASAAPLAIDGSHVNVLGVNEYLIGDSTGNVFAVPFGSTTKSWSLPLGGSLTGPAQAMADGTNNISMLAPISNPSNGQDVNPDCGSPGNCVALLSQDLQSSTVRLQCFMAAAGRVTAQPAGGVAFPGLAYFGDASGNLYAYSSGEDGNCALSAKVALGGGRAVVAGPIVMRNGSRDEIYFVTSSGGSGQFFDYSYSQGGHGLTLSEQPIQLAASTPVGLALEPGPLPARVAITFASGTVSIVQIATNFDPSLVKTAALGNRVWDAPYWCGQCPGGIRIGVGGGDGTLYLLDTNLKVAAAYLGGSPILTTPSADAAGDWFFAADDRLIHEVQQSGPAAIVPVKSFGPARAGISSSPVTDSCPAGICVYFASVDSNAYLLSFDARDAVLTACIGSGQSCSGVNPRLWVSAEIGVAGNPQVVHVQGWSYYSR